MEPSQSLYYVPKTKSRKISVSTDVPDVPLPRSSLNFTDAARTTIDALPNEIIIKIFGHYLETENQKDFFNNIRRVSSKWKLLSSDPSFWLSFDGSMDMKDLISCANYGLLDFCKTVKLPGCWDIQLQKALMHMKSICCLNLTNMEVISQEQWNALSNCKNITHIVFSEKYRQKPMLIDPYVKNWFSVCGPSLVVVNISFCELPFFLSLFHILASCCPNLLELHGDEVTGTSPMYFTLGEMQFGCPKLEKLCLDFDLKVMVIIDRPDQNDRVGFPQLRNFCFDCFEFPSWGIEAFLFASKKLEVLHLNIDIENEGLLSLPLENLHTLHLCRGWDLPYSDCCLWDPDAVSQILKRFSHQLKSLHMLDCLSKECMEFLKDLAFPDGSSKLQKLDVSVWGNLQF